MTNDQLKDTVIRKVKAACVKWATEEQLACIDNAMRLALYRVTLAEEEMALSTEVRTPNESYLKQFMMIKTVKGLSPKSLRLYANTVQRFFIIVDKPIPDVTSNDIRYYLAVRKGQDGVTNVTLGSELRNLKSFFTTLAAEEIIPRNPTNNIDAIKVEKRQKEPFTELEVELLRKAVQEPRSSHTNIKRNLAIIEVLYSTGCRVSELVTMRRSMLQGDRTKVVGKGNKERWVYLNPRAQVAIMDYLRTRTDDYDWLFPGYTYESRGEELMDAPLSTSSVESMVRKTGKRAGIANCHPHRFRRTAATIALRRGMPIDQVSKMLGHVDLNTTKIYAITADEDVRRNHEKYLT